jgi:hypothetical protein
VIAELNSATRNPRSTEGYSIDRALARVEAQA